MPAQPNQRRILFALLAATAVVFAWSGIAPHDRFTWVLEVFPVVFAVPLLWATYGRFPFTTLVYALVALHALVLMVGGHYTYALVPLGEWARAAFGFSRNHFDRLGHLAQGFVPAIIAREVLLRRTPPRTRAWLFTLVTAICLAISALYELLEWGVSEATGSAADAFLGTQGDYFDTQKDMATCLVGAVAAQFLLGKLHDRLLAALPPERFAGGRALLS